MTTTERTPLCTLAYCPAPKDPDWHLCLVCKSPHVEHDHTKGRSKTLTNNPRWVVPMCVPEHKKISLKQWTRGHIPADKSADGLIHYYILNERGETIFDAALPWMQRELGDGDEPVREEVSKARNHGAVRVAATRSRQDFPLVEALDTGGGDPAVKEIIGGPSTPLPVPVASSGRAEPTFTSGDAGSGTGLDEVGGADVSSGSALPSAYTDFDQWAEQGQRLARVIGSLPWTVGDWVNAGEDAFGEQASQHIEDLGVSVERLGEYARVARAFPVEERNPALTFSHHRAVAKHPERAQLLLRAASERLSVRETEAEVRGEPAEKCGGTCSGCGRECGRVK